MLPMAMLSLATALFPGVIYYQTITDTKSALGRFVPTGGMIHIGFWLVLGFYYRKKALDWFFNTTLFTLSCNTSVEII